MRIRNANYLLSIGWIFLCVITVFTACTDKDNGEADPRPLPVLNAQNITVTEGDEDEVIQIPVTLTGTNQTNAIVSFAAVERTASSPDDFTVLSAGRFQFSPGSTQEIIEVRIKSDEGPEPTESFDITFYNAINMYVEPQTITVTIEDDDDNTGSLVIPSGGPTSPEHYDGYNLVWRDEFNGDALNLQDWTFEIGNGCPNNCGWGNNELEYYREENTSIVNGHLVITAKRQEFGGADYTSSRIVTQGKQQFKFGRIDIRAALPSGQGVWPALWMLGSNFASAGWPSCGEIDIMELTGDLPNRVVSTVHYGSNLANHQFNSTYHFAPAGDSFQDRFHVYSINWENNLLEFLVDDVVVHTETPATMKNGQPYPFNKPFFFIMNVACGGNWPGSPDSSTKFPQHMIVDYVRVFQK